MTYTHIVFVGHHKDRLMDSITRFRKYPVHRVTLVLGDDDTTGERISRTVAAKVRSELAPLFRSLSRNLKKIDEMGFMMRE